MIGPDQPQDVTAIRTIVVLAGVLLAACAVPQSKPQEVAVFAPMAPAGTIRAVCDKAAADHPESLTTAEAELAARHCGGGNHYLPTHDAQMESAALAKAERSGRDSLSLAEVQVVDYVCHHRGLEAGYCQR
jgi:hypothetical protein